MPSFIADDMDFPRKSRWSIVLAWPLLFGLIIAFAISLAFGATLALAVAAGLLAGVLLVLGVMLVTTKLVEGQLGAAPADPEEHALLFNTVEALCLTNGLSTPKLVVIDELSPTVLTYGIRVSYARICVSAGFFTQLKAVEQEAVIAHALCRIHRGDFRSDSLCAVVFGFVLTPLGLRKLAGNYACALRGSDALLASDLAAVRLTRYPPALVSSLENIEHQNGPALPNYLDHLQIVPRQTQNEPVRGRIGVLVEV